MSVIRTFFKIPGNTSIKSIRRRLKTALDSVEVPVRVLQRTYLDSFDSRVYRAGAIIEENLQGDNRLLSWVSLEDSGSGPMVAIANPSRFIRDIPSGPLKRRLKPILNIRALLPVAHLNSEIQQLDIVNKQGQTTAHLVIEDNRISMAGSDDIRLGRLLYLQSVKGHRKQYQKAIAILMNKFAPDSAPLPLPLQAMAAVGYEPGTYSTSLALHLLPQMRTDTALRGILSALYKIMLANESGLKEDLDSEFLHDYRIAIRHNRVLLGQIKGIIPEKIVEEFRRGFSWLGEISSPCRDMDVHLLKFSGYKKGLPRAIRDDIDPLYEYLLRHKNIEHEKLVELLESDRYRAFKKDWQGFLDTQHAETDLPANASWPVVRVAGDHIWRVYRKINREGIAINKASPPEALHELRKSCKKLHYLMEMFQGLYPEKKIIRAINLLKSLQKLLGEYHDLHIQISSLHRFSDSMREEMDVHEKTCLAINVLIENLDKKQVCVREHFYECFARFSSVRNRKYFKSLFKPEINN